MTVLPNPFESTLEAAMPVGAAAGPDLTDPPVPAAVLFESRFVLDVDRFVAELDEPPLFLRTKPLRAEEMIGVLAVLAGH